jgi:hypothetical protein
MLRVLNYFKLSMIFYLYKQKCSTSEEMNKNVTFLPIATQQFCLLSYSLTMDISQCLPALLELPRGFQ